MEVFEIDAENLTPREINSQVKEAASCTAYLDLSKQVG